MLSEPSGDALPIRQLCEAGRMKTIKEQTQYGYKTGTCLCVCARVCVCVRACVIEFTDSYTQNASRRLASVLAQCIPRGTVCDKRFSGSSVTKK